jgi:UDP-2-acetamido-2,6-beta-L-arabino-hexul-4-ose reductase
MKILVTGAQGFIGKNLLSRLKERPDVEVMQFTRHSTVKQLIEYVQIADCIFHLAGINRPSDDAEFVSGNAELTAQLCELILQSGRRPKVVYTSSIQAVKDNPYGNSKLAAENALIELNESIAGHVHIFRLPNVFGKWCKPNYNSAVATFCHNISQGMEIKINNPDACVKLVYVDDVIDRLKVKDFI